MGTTNSKLSQDVVFEILSSPRRRYVLYYLRTIEEPVELTDLAEQVAAWENETDPEAITDQERKRVYVSLYQTHIPRLDEAGIIEYDKESGNITLAEEAGDIDRYLESETASYPWQYAYLVAAALGTALILLTGFDVSVLSAVPDSLAAILVVVGFAITALVHSYVRLTEQRTPPPELENGP